MLLQTNSYIVPKERRAEHARLLRRFRSILLRLGCDLFEVYEQMGPNWGSGDATGRFVQLMRFRDRKHQRQVHAAEQSDPAAQQLINEFCDLINLPYQQQQGLLAIGYYQGVVEAPTPGRPRGWQPPPEAAAAGDEPHAPVGFGGAAGAAGFGAAAGLGGAGAAMLPLPLDEADPSGEVEAVDSLEDAGGEAYADGEPATAEPEPGSANETPFELTADAGIDEAAEKLVDLPPTAEDASSAEADRFAPEPFDAWTEGVAGAAEEPPAAASEYEAQTTAALGTAADALSAPAPPDQTSNGAALDDLLPAEPSAGHEWDSPGTGEEPRVNGGAAEAPLPDGNGPLGLDPDKDVRPPDADSAPDEWTGATETTSELSVSVPPEVATVDGSEWGIGGGEEGPEGEAVVNQTGDDTADEVAEELIGTADRSDGHAGPGPDGEFIPTPAGEDRTYAPTDTAGDLPAQTYEALLTHLSADEGDIEIVYERPPEVVYTTDEEDEALASEVGDAGEEVRPDELEAAFTMALGTGGTGAAETREVS